MQALLRFLSREAKVPLATAMSKVKSLQQANLDSPEKLAKMKAKDVSSIFTDEKMAKQTIAAAKRVSKKRAAGEDSAPSPKKQRENNLFSEDVVTPQQLEASLELHDSVATDVELMKAVVITNRAPLVLAFAVTLLKYTMPEQPLSSRLSLAQGYVSTTSRSRAVSLGIQQISKEEEAQEAVLGEGQPLVTVMGKELRVLRRWGYEWRCTEVDVGSSINETIHADTETDEKPALWALDLEALRKSNRTGPVVAGSAANSNLPIYTPQAARTYLQKSFDVPPADDGDKSAKKLSATARAAEKERNLGKLLRALDLLYGFWAETLSPAELDKRTWRWYVDVRPSVENGVAGWGGKNEVRLADILALRRQA
ncbi:hypothetical protein LTR08_001320 [Meristemomyces frigidus]|nr:hypothetical protein LTR08_001320 [Meristemomyces frigidus]